jgi:L-lactate dehydrogenase (cytochrome)
MSVTNTEAALQPAPTPRAELAVARPVSTVPHAMRRFLSLSDFEREGARFLPPMMAGFVSGGVETNAAREDNRAAFQDYAFIPRVLAGASNRNIKTTLFGRTYDAPFGISPMGGSGALAYRAELAYATASAAANIPMMLSGASTIRMEEVRQNGPTAWYQAYLPGEIPRIEGLVDRVIAAGFDTFVLTADVPVPGNRENNARSGYTMPLKPSLRLGWQMLTHPRWFFGTAVRTLVKHGVPHIENLDVQRGPPVISRNLVRYVGQREKLSWEHVELIRRRFPGKVLVKGILAKEDAITARDLGVDGIVVSNHGGRQLDNAVAPLRVLADIVSVAGDMTVIMDGGVRRGTDVLKALALGAHFVFLGRPFLFAAALGGEVGVAHAIKLLAAEIDRNLALLGLRDIAQMGPEMLTRITRP